MQAVLSKPGLQPGFEGPQAASFNSDTGDGFSGRPFYCVERSASSRNCNIGQTAYTQKLLSLPLFPTFFFNVTSFRGGGLPIDTLQVMVVPKEQNIKCARERCFILITKRNQFSFLFFPQDADLATHRQFFMKKHPCHRGYSKRYTLLQGELSSITRFFKGVTYVVMPIVQKGNSLD